MELISNQSSQRCHFMLRNGLVFFGITLMVSTVGYVIAGWSWIDAFYMVTITIFGVGYQEVQTLDSMGMKAFTIAVIFFGCSSLIFVVGGIVQILTEGEITRIMGKRNMSREVNSLAGHIIVCGYGRIGRVLATELREQGKPLVILDRNSERVEQAIDDGFLAMEGNCTEDLTLQDAGIYRASVLATVLPDDATNVFITLTARGMSDSVRIISRAESPSTENKLIRSGANHVVIPSAIGAIRVAQLATENPEDLETLPENRYRMLDNSSRSEHALIAAIRQDELDRSKNEQASELVSSES